MNSVVIGHPNVFDSDTTLDSQIISIAGMDISIGLVKAEVLAFDPVLNPHKILIKKIAFSCNFRDKGVSMQIFRSCIRKSTPDNYMYSGFGSEFVAEVLAVGMNIEHIKKGDKVIPNCAYPTSRSRTPPGIPTNFSSERYSIFDEEQLIKVPNNLNNEIAASLTIAGQTVYSIIRRANIKKGQSIILTAASSNTSLFAMEALKNTGVNIVGITSSYDKIDALKELGYQHVVISPQIDPKPLQKFTDKFGGFDIVIDPFYDLYLNYIVDHMNYYSKYFTCGLYRQSATFEKSDLENINSNFLTQLLIKNISVIGNCLGTKEDLENAIVDVANGNSKIIIDSSFSGNRYGDFINRTFSDPDRIGKVVYTY